jgi:transposase InsO family protein
VAFLCRRYKVSRSGFYAWERRDRGRRGRADEELGARIERIHRDSGKRYGSPRVHEVLRREGIRLSNKRVARLMRERGLRARVSRLYRRGSGVVRRFFAKTGNLRLQEPLPTRPDQIWVGDLTYLRLGKRWRYLATVMDLFSRRIIGWTLARNRTTDVTLRALKRAISLREPRPGLLFHSDRGIEYSAYGYQDFLKARGIVPSMNRPRHCQDNAHMESFFHSLKAELTHQRAFGSDAELNASVAGYIDRYYNAKRIHSSLGYHSPVEFERLANASRSVYQIG